jgi:hypothetical protein
VADLVRTIGTNFSLQTSNCRADLTKPPSSVADPCIPEREPTYSNLYKVPSHVGTHVCQRLITLSCKDQAIGKHFSLIPFPESRDNSAC